jgi:hypothetical protein
VPALPPGEYEVHINFGRSSIVAFA